MMSTWKTQTIFFKMLPNWQILQIRLILLWNIAKLRNSINLVQNVLKLTNFTNLIQIMLNKNMKLQFFISWHCVIWLISIQTDYLICNDCQHIHKRLFIKHSRSSIKPTFNLHNKLTHLSSGSEWHLKAIKNQRSHL